MLGAKEVPPVARYALTAHKPTEREEEDINAELYAVMSARSSLLGIERLSATHLDERAHRLKADLKFATSGYKRLSLEPLTWTSKWSHYPIFAFHSLHSPSMVLRSDKAVRDNSGDWLPEPTGLPEPIREIYHRHQQALSRGRITSFFQGVMPKNVREDIKAATPDFTVENPQKTNIFLIGEAKWIEGAEPEPPRIPWYQRIDPLVVGWDGNDLWLISHFDLTSIERYMMDEFPALPGHTDLMVLPEKK